MPDGERKPTLEPGRRYTMTEERERRLRMLRENEQHFAGPGSPQPGGSGRPMVDLSIQEIYLEEVWEQEDAWVRLTGTCPVDTWTVTNLETGDSLSFPVRTRLEAHHRAVAVWVQQWHAGIGGVPQVPLKVRRHNQPTVSVTDFKAAVSLLPDLRLVGCMETYDAANFLGLSTREYEAVEAGRRDIAWQQVQSLASRCQVLLVMSDSHENAPGAL